MNLIRKTIDLLNLFDSGETPDLDAEEEWEPTFNAMNAAIWIIDEDYQILKSNFTAQKIFNLAPDKMIGRKCFEIVHGTKAPIEECPILKARESRKRESAELLLDNNWVEVVIDPIFDETNTFRKAVHIVTDITENKRLKDRLIRSERILSNTEKLSRTGGWEWDNLKRKMFWTEELYSIHELDPNRYETGSKEHISASLECYSLKDRKALLRAFNQCIEEGKSYDFEMEFTKPSGKTIWVRTAARPVWNGNRIEKVTGHLMDISGFKKARDEIKAQSEQLTKFFDAIDDAIFIHPFKAEGFGKFVEVNQIACSRYGYTHDEMLALSPPDITVKANSNSHKKKDHRQELYEKKQLIFESLHVRKSGETFPVEINSNIFFQHQEPYILAVVRDISERKRNEEKREQLILELRDALDNIKTLKGLLPICSYCKKIRDDQGYWNRLEYYLAKYSDVSFSHGLCPECSDKQYGDEEWYIEYKKKKKKE